ncbi:MAG TPA: von Willebrand factor type A domain-containing protein [Pirellulales bacterium]|nr:von Willebrand factor type A domain-containing protein [Pirellulales bacterium]
MSEPWPCENEPPDRENWLDAELRRVAAPRGLLARLRTIPGGILASSFSSGSFAGSNDEALDAMLRDVPLPARLVGRLLEIGAADCDGGRRRSRLESRAVAASLVVMTWCSYAAALVLFWLADYPFARAAAANWLQAASPLEGSLEIAEPETMTLVDAALLDAPLIGSDDRLADGLAESLYGDARAAEGLPDARLLAFHSPSIFSAMLDFPATAVREVAGADVPDEPGFDRSFLSRTGVFPRVDPRRHPVSRAPLTTESTSYDLARQCLAEGRLPNSDEIRTEEFLAGVDYGLPRPEQSGLALFVAGCQAPWTISRGAAAGERSWLLQIAVQASDFASDADAAAEPDVTEIVAADVRLSVRFNPQTIESYRLYGHEPTRWEGTKLEPTCNLRCGQTASVVYELQFGPTRGAEAASVTLQWRDPRSGAVRRSSRSIRPPDFATDMTGAPPGLRLAALAVAAAEELRESPFAETIAPSKMLDLARQGATGADLPSEFQKFVDVFEPLLAAQSGSKALAPKPASRQEPNSP